MAHDTAASNEGVAARTPERLRQLLDALDAGIWEWHLDTGECVFNQGWYDLLGYSRDQFEPRIESYRQLLHPEDVDASNRDLSSYLEAGVGTYRHQERLRHRDGRWIWVQQRARLVERGADGAPALVVGLTTDISETRAAQEQLRHSSIYARSLLEASLDPLVTIGTDGRIMDVNRATETATGMARDAIIGTDFSDYFTEPEHARAGYRQVFTLGQVKDYPLTLQHRSGSTLEVLYNATTFHDEEGHVAGVFAAARDVTEARRAQRDLEATNQEALLLSRMSNLLHSCQSVEEAMPILRASLTGLMPDAGGRVLIFDMSSHRLDQVLDWGVDGDPIIALNADQCWALRRSAIHEVSAEEPLNPRCHAMEADGRPFLCIPLLAQGQSLGIVHLIADAGITDRLRRLARSTADTMSLALANIRLRENLQTLSTRDPLTGLYNRRYMEDALAREFARAGRSKKLGVIALMDIDHFKAYNDTYGHDAGDAVLVEVAARMRQFRATDLACRYGGEEFLLVLTELGMEQAQEKLEELRDELRGLQVVHAGQVLPGITISVGATAFPTAHKDVAATIRLADEALYRAKTNGRDRLEIADPSL